MIKWLTSWLCGKRQTASGQTGASKPTTAPLDYQWQPTPTVAPDDPRTALFARIGEINDPAKPRPLVSLELFFEGNSDYGSIGYNLPDQPEPAVFYNLLKALRDRPDVHDVLIEVKDLEDVKGWPATDTMWFITTASPDDVRNWFPQALVPDDMVKGFDGPHQNIEPYDIPQGYTAIGAWYD